MVKKKRAAAEHEDVAEQEDSERKIIPVQIGPISGVQHINFHPCTDGMVVGMTQEDIDAHRSQGVPLLDVPSDYDGEVYDVYAEWVNPDHEAA